MSAPTMPGIANVAMSGVGEYDFGALNTVIECLIKIDTIGSARVHHTGNQPRVQHAGMVGIYYINDQDSLHDVIWWKFIDFLNEDIPVHGVPFGAHGMFWNLDPGVEGRLSMWWT